MQPRITDHLRRRCQALRREDRAALAGLLLQSLEEKKEDHPWEVLDELRDGIKDQYQIDIMDKCRVQPGPFLRMVFAYLALERTPLTQSDVARYLHIRPCSVNYYVRVVKDALATHGSNPPLMMIYKHLIQSL